MARSLRHDAAAETDLIDIWLFTAERWSAAQADRYLDEIANAVRKLCRSPRSGTPRDELLAGYFSKRVQKHIVFYTFGAKELRVRRVLHGAMDPGQHL